MDMPSIGPRCAGWISRTSRRRSFRACCSHRKRCVEGGPLPCALNAADEIAVAAFLEKKLSFLGIAAVIERVLEKMPRTPMRAIEDVLDADAEARRLARLEVARRTN